MPWIAGQSQCQKQVFSAPENSNMTAYTAAGVTYTPSSWIETKADCKEKAEVFTFVTEKFMLTTANYVFFGVVKAVFNFITGVVCDSLGRKWAVIVGWCCAIPMPLMVIFADNWWTVAASNIFLGMQQALVWSATIFIMIDYLGQVFSPTTLRNMSLNPWTGLDCTGSKTDAMQQSSSKRVGRMAAAMALVRASHDLLANACSFDLAHACRRTRAPPLE